MPSADPQPPRRRVHIRRVLLAIACASLAWAAWLAWVGGFDGSLLGVRLRSNDPRRVLLIALVALAGYRLAGGAIRLSPAIQALRRASVGIARRPGVVAGAIAALLVGITVAGSTRIGGGSDAYGYVSQAELWLAGDLIVDQSWVAEVPWPDAMWTFTPLGYRPLEGQWAIVPTYSAGLPMLLAAAKLLGGQCAMFLVCPLLGGLAVLATYGLGCRLGSPVAGLAASWFVATSPVVVDSIDPVTDVPVMAMWALAMYFGLGRGSWSALAAGTFAAAAILIRPNLFPLAAPLGLWLLVRKSTDPAGLRSKVVPVLLFSSAVLAGILAVAAINDALYGSWATSGYGRLEDQMAISRIGPNLRRYLSWLVESHTPLAVIGLAALAIPSRRLWPGVHDRRVFVSFGIFTILLWGMYAAYLEFDSWSYLRFLLPGWPLIFLGLASIAVAVARMNRAMAWVVGGAVLALGLWNVHVADRSGAFDQRQAARHEAPIGRLVQEYTPSNSALLAFHRSGSLRYYGGRTTVRYDLLPPEWLDRAVAWMGQRGVGVYAVLDERELLEVRGRFAGQQTIRAFDHPVWVYEPAGTALFDLSPARDASRPPIRFVEAFRDLAGCDPPVRWHPLQVRDPSRAALRVRQGGDTNRTVSAYDDVSRVFVSHFFSWEAGRTLPSACLGRR